VGRTAQPTPETVKDEVIIVLGHRDPGSPTRHLLSRHGAHRVTRAQTLSYGSRVRAVIFSGSSTTGPPSEAVQMQTLWNGCPVPLILEEQSLSTAENAAYCLEIVRAMPGVTKITVVTCNWHFRTRYMFAPYKKLGLTVQYRHFPDGPKDILLNLWNELRQLPHIRRVRAAAFAVGNAALPEVRTLG
jgi:uncharacterized SAM-binding protein YcdF (DUF218 family)